MSNYKCRITNKQLTLKLSLAILTFTVSAHASSLSELNTKGFNDRAKPAVRSTENPFLKQNVSPEDLLVEDLNLTGIIYGSNEAYALISGNTVKEGDVIAGFKVKSIEKDHVVLRQLDQVKILRLE